jgi:hypothetical protein
MAYKAMQRDATLGRISRRVETVDRARRLRRWGRLGIVKSASRQSRRLQESLRLPQALRGPMEGACASGGARLIAGFFASSADVENLKPRQLLSTEISTAGAVELRRYTGASSPSLLSSFLSALCAVGHVQASAEAASSIIISASQVRIFQRGLSLQRLTT